MEDNGDCLNKKTEEFMEHVCRYFVEKARLMSECKCEFWPVEDGNGEENDGHGFEITLWRLRVEMIELMQCDVQLWKQLTELHSSIATLKENIRIETLYRESPASVSSASSETGSFVSAEEYIEVCPSDYSQNRVLSWINQYDQAGTVSEDSNEEQQLISTGLRSQTSDGIYSRRRDKNNLGDVLFKTFIIAKPLNSSRVDACTYTCSINYSQDVWNAGISDACLVTVPRSVCNMKSLEEREIVSERNFRYYKSSLRLLGSIRMRSRIFEPSLTKWRPFALSQTSDSFIIVPPTAFSNIQPRPKLHRLCNVFDNRIVQPDDEKYVHNVGNEVKESEGHLEIEIHRENAEEAGKINSAEEAGDDLQIPIYVRELRENVAEIWNANVSLSAEHGDTDQITGSSNGFKEQLDGTNTSENASASDTDSDSFYPNFLEVKDGLITCQIMSPELEKELNQAITEHEEFEYLMIVDGRVTFTPHTRDNDREESYYLGWLFENTEFDNNEDSYFIHLLFEETDSKQINTELLRTKESFFIRHLFQETDTECVETARNDECEESFYISHLFKDIEAKTETANDEVWDSYNIRELFQQPDTCNEILTDEYKELCSCSQSSLDTEHMTLLHGDSSTDTVCDTFALQESERFILQETDSSALQEKDSALQKLDNFALQETDNSALHETNSALQELDNSALHEAGDSALQEMDNFALHETYNSVLQETYNFALQETYNSALH